MIISSDYQNTPQLEKENLISEENLTEVYSTAEKEKISYKKVFRKQKIIKSTHLSFSKNLTLMYLEELNLQLVADANIDLTKDFNSNEFVDENSNDDNVEKVQYGELRKAAGQCLCNAVIRQLDALPSACFSPCEST